jgi:hypothetical protein
MICLAYEKRLLEKALDRCRHNQLRHALRRHDLIDRTAAQADKV